jgi:hypothetical protein
MQEFKKLRDLTSTKEEYDQLCNTDHIFVVYGRDLDDNEIFNAVGNLDHFEWASKLRGDPDQPKIANTQNNHKWFHGYIYGVSHKSLSKFERNALIAGLSTGYTFEKLDLFQSKKESKDNHFDLLFEEA